MFEYFSTGVKEFLFGEGFTYYSNWLIERFGHDELYQFSDGQIFNTFASVGISTGAIGLFIYLIFLNSLRKSIYFNNMDILFFYNDSFFIFWTSRLFFMVSDDFN